MASIRRWHISGIIGPIDYALRMQNALYGNTKTTVCQNDFDIP